MFSKYALMSALLLAEFKAHKDFFTFENNLWLQFFLLYKGT